MATHLTELLTHAEMKDNLKLCIVQTAYANGNSTNFIEKVMVGIDLKFSFFYRNFH